MPPRTLPSLLRRLYPFRRTFHTTPHPLLPRSKPTPPPPQPPSSSDDYYSLLLSQPLSSTAPATSFPSLSPPSPLPPKPSSHKPPSRDPSIIFGTPLAGPSAARRRAGYGDEPYATGGLERPREPDNCCMSGCVNCVWDAYREEVEAWAVRRREAAAKVAREREYSVGEEEAEGEKRKARQMRGRGRRVVGGKGGVGGTGVGDMDEMGRGWNLDDEGALFEGVPVGIREFMATEKRLRERREREGKEGRDKGGGG
ncbi:MAG: hypothetical protein Q9184_005684 [Pyrenodesmia sp. 2 TL-2023]